jgi:hypothetical protein
MGEGDKKEWDKKAKEAKEAYDKEYKDWLESGGAEAIKQVRGVGTKDLCSGVHGDFC